MHTLLRSLLISALCLTSLTPAHAEQYVTVGAGWFNFSNNDHSSTDFLAEYRGNPFYNHFVPVIGANINTDDGVIGYAGVNYDWEFAPQWVLTPGVAVGAWHQGDSKDLGGTLEFRESLELDYKFTNEYRLGAQVNHISNAGIYDRNPGTNSILATLSVPLGPYR